MKNNEATVFVFIASIIMGVLISLNLNVKNQNKYVPLSSKEYQEALNKRNKLYKDISELKHDNTDLKQKINKYKYDDEKSDKLINDIKLEVNNNDILAGLTAVKGEGIKMVIKDASNEFPEYVKDFAFTRVLHDYDMMNVVNELKNVGAEAISINNQRVVENTSIFCSGPFLEINKVNTPAPFYIYAIGDPEIMEQNLMNSDSYIKKLLNRGLQIKITKEKDLTISAYIGKLPTDNLTNFIK
ncbi:DUF881 domain-containing protein [Clostridium fallax]|uniref:Uncharacterized conserved protein YlxW, UPF0749 family n=1 Tax=Clostridium fallax TaxID=1533 RepID=A0A1M4YIY0_9CLOT|nr:DUF881 domain-containing protein [Clostridium fallax]SHF05687.1 Uncharacterized conserved protein YlxW, UPF0749 family [Clostridium fallax]SQB06307.1 division initiation protein [Clostridium fallax]